MFDKYFEVFLADTEESQNIHYRIRYQVYCLETGYENPFAYPQKMERDNFDDRSVHFIVRSRATGDWIAAMRLVLGPLDNLPINQFARIEPEPLFKRIGAVSLRDLSTCAEVSRLCVVSQYRRRSQERNVPYQVPFTPDNGSTPDPSAERRKAPWLMLGLIRAARDYSNEHNIRYWFILTAKSLARIIQTLGMELEIIGPECEHRGKRSPYVGVLANGFDKLSVISPEVARAWGQLDHYQNFSELPQKQLHIPLAL